MTIERFTPNRRTFLGLGAAGLSAPLLASCAGDISSGEGELGQVDFSAPSQYRDREMNVVLWSATGGTNGEQLQELIDGFNESQTDIYAEVQYQGGYEESGPKVTAALQAGSVPDVAMFADTWWPRFLLNDVLEPMDDYFTADYNSDSYVGQVFDEGSASGSTYWISFGRSTPLFYYNKDYFTEVGLPDRGPQTWTELREWAAELNQLQVSGQALPAHAFSSGDDWPFMAMIWQFGGRISDGLEIHIDGAEAVEAGEWAQRFIHDDNFGYLAQSPNTDFGAGVVATTVGSTGSLRGIYEEADFEVGAAFLPQESTHGVPTGGNGFSMFKNVPAERKEAAFEVLKYLGSPASSAAWTLGTGYLPVVAAARDEPELAEVLAADPNFNAAAEQLEISQPTDAVRQMVTDSTATIISGVQEIFSNGSTDVRATFDNVAAQLRDGAESVQDDYEQWFG
ncbi:ABC transporter substrate-binding protein [Ruania halotolerans]|uniref:ABC transporter substrate-binding protein n=1 Tax=Ruania halotolerans TaxID=2897773 RepID=UPI001E50C821|nr:ABC transporter substrate-binding protein [Ruania halotolerans]UFU06764.1 ABC transporter substrate-binding protein [Ruania halotolerans]